MKFSDWYTDTVDVWRVVPEKVGNLTRNTRTELCAGIPCRIFSKHSPAPRMTETAAEIDHDDYMQCDNSADIKAGDELILHRGAKLGKDVRIRAFAGEPHYFYEPFGAVAPGLAHQEIALKDRERL